MEEHYTKLQIERLICWIDSIERDLQSQVYAIPEINEIRKAERKVNEVKKVLWKWQAKLESGKIIFK